MAVTPPDMPLRLPPMRRAIDGSCPDLDSKARGEPFDRATRARRRAAL